MRGLIGLIAFALTTSVKGVRLSFAPRNRRVTAAVLAGGATIAAVNWLAISQPGGKSILGLTPDGATGTLFAPAIGGIATGVVAGFSRRPLYADAKAGSFAAFAGMAMLMTWAGIARATGGLPDGGIGFERFGIVSGTVFVLIVGSANVFITFPVAFVVTFTSRSIVPSNQHRYGWAEDEEENPAFVYVTPGLTGDRKDLSRYSTAFSRFSQTPPRFSKVPSRFRDSEPE